MGSEKRIENIRAGSVILKGVRETIDKSRPKVSLVERLDVGAEEKEKTNVEKLEQALFKECDNLLEKISNINSDEEVEACKNELNNFIVGDIPNYLGMSDVASDLRNFAVIDPDNHATPRLKFLTEIRNKVFELKKAFEEKVIAFEAQKQTPEFVEQDNQKNLENMEETNKKKRTKQDYEIKWERYQKYINKEKMKSIEYGKLKKDGLSGVINFFKIRRLEREIGELKMKIAKTEKALNKTRKIELLD